MHYKAPNDLNPHYLSEQDIANGGEALLPAGSVPIADDEAEAMRIAAIPAPVPPTPLQEITALEQSKPITHRMLRDLSMTVAQIAAAVTGTDMMTNPAVREIATMNAQIDALREEAKVQGLIP